jgi:peptidoglycan/LPS O-acetylase OafA/YrhL
MRSTAVRAQANTQPRTVRDNQAINALRSLAAVAVVVGHIRTLFFQDYAVVPHTRPSRSAMPGRCSATAR